MRTSRPSRPSSPTRRSSWRDATSTSAKAASAATRRWSGRCGRRPSATAITRKAGEFVYDHPFLWGSKRTGPDLHRIGGKYPDAWHFVHMKDPRRHLAGVDHAGILRGSIRPARHLAHRGKDHHAAAAGRALSRGFERQAEGRPEGAGGGDCRRAESAVASTRRPIVKSSRSLPTCSASAPTSRRGPRPPMPGPRCLRGPYRRRPVMYKEIAARH